MVNAQEWLDQNYPKETRSEIKVLNISFKDLARELDLSDFINLEQLYCSNNKLTNLKLNNCQKLKELWCNDNKLTNLNLSELRELENIECSNNYLTNFDYSSLDPNKLTYLNISDNNLSEQDLSVFSKFTNLSSLWIGGDNKEHFANNIYNKFTGSLEPLKNLTKLITLHISNTDLDSDWEYLPPSVENIYYSIKEKPESKVKELVEELKWIEKGFSSHQLKEWTKAGYQPQDYGFAVYLTKQGYQPQDDLNLEELKAKYNKSQGWLDQKYPREQRSEVREIYLNEPNLEGELDLGDFTRSLKILIFYPINETKLTFKNLPEEAKITKLQNAQTWLESQEEYNASEKRQKTKELNINYENLEGHLDLSDFTNLEKLNCTWNNLTSLNLTNCINLKELNCVKNKLSHLDLSKNINLQKLIISDNNFPQENSTWLSHLVNLEELNLGNNKFTGSLEFTKNMDKLEKLSIYGTNLTTGLEFLPTNLLAIDCGKDGKIWEELNLYNKNLPLWQVTHPELMKKAGKEPIVLSYYEEIKLEKVTTTPEFLQEELEKELIFFENYHPPLNYSDFLLRDGRSFTWETLPKVNSQKQLPLRLYNLATGQVEETEGRTDIPNYLALSYCWGTDWEEEGKKYGQDYETKLTKLGRKALNKVLATWKLINPQQKDNLNYIWIDNFCINQQDPKEKGQEVANQRHYYNNASATLIAIDAEIGNQVNKENEVELSKHVLTKIITSPWFTRSWTFQEGLLSKQTIFMLDDYLVDGRILALAWGSLQNDYSLNSSSLQLENNARQISITPLGWSYDFQVEQKVNLTLGESLLAVKHRKQTVIVDGIYSILGLLPYGDKVKTNYKYFGQKYTKEDLEKSLSSVVKEAIQQGYGQEIFSWFGSRHNQPELWLIPQVHTNGSTEIEKIHDYQFKNMKISLQGIQLEGKIYRIDEIFLKYENRIFIRSRGKNYPLTGTIKTILQIQVGDNLVVIGEKGVIEYIVILMPNNTDHSIDLVELQTDKKPTSKEIFADLVNRRIICGRESISHYQELLKDKDKQLELTNFLEWNKWRVIHEEFTQELVQKWKDGGFSYEQVCEWASAFRDEFNFSEVNFYLWLKDEKKLTAKECADEYSNTGEIEKSNSRLRNSLIISYWYPNNNFEQSELYGISNEGHEAHKSFNDLITINKNLGLTEVKDILIREIKISHDEDSFDGVKGIQYTYQIKSEGKRYLIESERHGCEGTKLATIKLADREYLTKLEGWNDSFNIKGLLLFTTNSTGEEKVYGPYGKKEGENFSLLINNDQRTSVFYGKVSNSLKSLGIQQTLRQLTSEDLIAQMEIPSKGNN